MISHRFMHWPGALSRRRFREWPDRAARAGERRRQEPQAG